MFHHPGPSWQVRLDAPDDLHLALFVRDRCGLPAETVGPLLDPPGPTDAGPAGERANTAAAWRAWWQSLLSEHHPMPVAMHERMAQAARRFAGPRTDFAQLAETPALREAAVQAWHGDFRQWWETPLAREPAGAVPEIPIGGVRGGLIATIQAHSRRGDAQKVVAELERELGRKANPFELTIDVLAVDGDTAVPVAAGYALVPVGLFGDPVRYPELLHELAGPLA